MVHTLEVMLVYVAVLFFLLVPGILFRIPPKSSALIVAALHAVLFAVIHHYTYQYTQEHFKGAWVKMADKGWSNDGGVSATYCDENSTFSPGPPPTCIGTESIQAKPQGSFAPVCPKGQIFFGGMGMCSDPAPPYGNRSKPSCPGGVFDPASSSCLPTKAVVADDNKCPPGCAPIDEDDD
jgi:hypothetical protein